MDWGGGHRHFLVALPPEKDPVRIVYVAGWAPGPVWTGVENLASTGIRSPDRPARRQSLYRLSCLGLVVRIIVSEASHYAIFSSLLIPALYQAEPQILSSTQ